MSEFVVKWRTRCMACGEWIEVGETARYDADSNIVDKYCADPPPERPAKVCPTCFMTTCDCGKEV